MRVRSRGEELVWVIVEDTGVEMAIPRRVYEAYAKDFRFVREDSYKPPEPEVVPPPAPPTIKPLEDMTHSELKDAATIAELTFKGNASRENLIAMLKEV